MADDDEAFNVRRRRSRPVAIVEDSDSSEELPPHDNDEDFTPDSKHLPPKKRRVMRKVAEIACEFCSRQFQSRAAMTSHRRFCVANPACPPTKRRSRVVRSAEPLDEDDAIVVRETVEWLVGNASGDPPATRRSLRQRSQLPPLHDHLSLLIAQQLEPWNESGESAESDASEYEASDAEEEKVDEDEERSAGSASSLFDFIARSSKGGKSPEPRRIVKITKARLATVIRSFSELPPVVEGDAGKKSNRCRVCGLVCATYDDVRFHCRVSMDPAHQPYRCAICAKTFAWTSSLVAHEAAHGVYTGPPFKCEVCGRRNLRTVQEIRRHLMVEHSWRMRECDICDFLCELSPALADHREREHGEPADAFETSDEEFDDTEESGEHSSLNVNQCEHCGRSFLNQSGVVSHRKFCRSRRGSTDGAVGRFPLRCPFCARTRRSMTLLREHVLEKHSRALAACAGEECGIDQSGEIARSAVTRRRISCEICGRKYVGAKSLANHRAVAHLDGGGGTVVPLLCGVCARPFASERRLARHVAKVHVAGDAGVDVVEKVACDVCAKEFGGVERLEEHIRVAHVSGERTRKYACTMCDRSYLRSDHLARHRQRAHWRPGDALPKPRKRPDDAASAASFTKPDLSIGADGGSERGTLEMESVTSSSFSLPQISSVGADGIESG